jgi:pimeloyl-ACP methyl ester carboxylesterase
MLTEQPGDGVQTASGAVVRPFTVEVAEEALRDLRERLERTRWPDAVDDAGWDYGANLAYLRELVSYWRSQFDWRAQERILNQFTQYIATVDGFDIHFIHERAKGPRPLPLVLTHGWPGSFFEMHKLIPLLTDPARFGADPADAFDVIVPSLPGFGFSERPRYAGMARDRIVDLWAALMTETLGYARFAAHGGDIGASITTGLGRRYPDRVLGIHLTAVADPYLGRDAPELSAAEHAFVALQRRWEDDEGAYGHQQRTRPQTLAYGLNDSPAGLASWIVEKFRAWSDCDGDVERRFTKDELLTTIMIYWVTQTISSSIRLYYETRRHPQPPFSAGERITVPCGVALTTEAADRAPREWAERTYNVRRWTELSRGGHFLALEEPELLAEELRVFFRPQRAAEKARQ